MQEFEREVINRARDTFKLASGMYLRPAEGGEQIEPVMEDGDRCDDFFVEFYKRLRDRSPEIDRIFKERLGQSSDSEKWAMQRSHLKDAIARVWTFAEEAARYPVEAAGPNSNYEPLNVLSRTAAIHSVKGGMGLTSEHYKIFVDEFLKTIIDFHPEISSDPADSNVMNIRKKQIQRDWQAIFDPVVTYFLKYS